MTHARTAPRRPFAATLLFASTLALAACGGGGDPAAGGAGPGAGAPPPPLVEAMTVTTGTVPNIVELPGRIEPVRVAEVRARTDGIIERRFFTEGTDVVAGAALFRIDPRDYAAQVEAARGALSRAQAQRTNAQALLRRYAPLVRDRAVSGQEFDTATAASAQADAGVAEARAALQRAQLQLSYTTVRAPISGRIGRAAVTEGALVSATQATPLTTIGQISPVYAVFEASNTSILNLIQQNRVAASPSTNALRQVEVRLILANGSDYGVVGRLDFADSQVDPATGSQQLRATFPNPNRLLLAGQFVRGRLALGAADGIVLPARAVQIGERGATVTVVAADGTTQPRPVQLGGQTGNSWVIRSGLRAGERVITDGWQKIQAPGMKVTVRGDRPAAGAPAPAAAGAAR